MVQPFEPREKTVPTVETVLGVLGRRKPRPSGVDGKGKMFCSGNKNPPNQTVTEGALYLATSVSKVAGGKTKLARSSSERLTTCSEQTRKQRAPFFNSAMVAQEECNGPSWVVEEGSVWSKIVVGGEEKKGAEEIQRSCAYPSEF